MRVRAAASQHLPGEIRREILSVKHQMTLKHPVVYQPLKTAISGLRRSNNQCLLNPVPDAPIVYESRSVSAWGDGTPYLTGVW